MEALKALATDLNSGIKHLKRHNKNEDKAAFGAIKSLAYGEKVKEKGLLPQFQRLSLWTGVQLVAE